MRLKRLLYKYNGVTAGEKLYLYLRSEFIDTQAWEETRETLEATSRALELIDLFQQIAAVNLAGRLVVAGSSFADRNPVRDPLFQQAFSDFIQDTIGETGERVDVRKRVNQLLAFQEEQFWTVGWTASSLDTRAGRDLVLEALSLVARNKRAELPWYEGVSLIDVNQVEHLADEEPPSS